MATPYGLLSAEVYARLFPEPIEVVQKWPWKEVLPSILGFLGCSIDAVVSSPRVAASVRVLWKLRKAADRLAREQEDRDLKALHLWWRQLGAPVACPLCGREDNCDCARKEPWASLLRQRSESLPGVLLTGEAE